MEECFDPEIVFYTQHGEYRGREEVMRYLSRRYFKFAPKLHYEVRPQDVRSFGDLLWYSYDFWIDTPRSNVPDMGCPCAERMPEAGGASSICTIRSRKRPMPLTRYTDPVLEQWSVIARRPKLNPESHRSPMFLKPIASWKSTLA